MSTATKLVTADELFRMPDDAYRLELIDGELRQMSPGGSVHGYVGIEIACGSPTMSEAKNLGCVIGAETGYVVERDQFQHRLHSRDSCFGHSRQAAKQSRFPRKCAPPGDI